jgi:NDP-sugar pyrophosphorylase family protein
MAGRSSRFFDAGFKESKYKIEIEGHPILFWVLKSFERYKSSEIVLILGEHNSDDKKFVEDIASHLFEKVTVNVLTTTTYGQADTVMFGLQTLEMRDDQPLLIFNIDTIRPGFYCPEYGQSSLWVETFNGQGSHWSFISKDDAEERRVIQIAEKVRISNFCCTGAYYFPSFQLYHELWSSCFLNETWKFEGEHYVSHVISEGLSRGIPTFYDNVPEDKVLLCGTPEEYSVLVEKSLIHAFRNV